jgi:16S rRNA (uracil1498-N3)-methyltransferase
VLRLRPGEKVVALDNLGNEYEVELVETGQAVSGKILAKRAAAGEPICQISLYLSLTQREKFEWMLQKCTEVGACAFIPVFTSRSLISRGQGDDEQETSRKFQRWQRIIQEAAEQCGRGRIPKLYPPRRFKEAVALSQIENEMALIPYEGESTLSIKSALKAMGPGKQTLGLFIGPEGGFSNEEIALARQAGIQPVTLGRRILRLETAAIAAVLLALSELGD